MTKTTATKTVKISTRTVGSMFATAGIVKFRNGRVAHETRDFPYGFTGPALESAESWAIANGYRVA